MKKFSHVEGLLIAIFTAILGGSSFLTIIAGIFYLIRAMAPISQSEAAPPLWFFFLVIAVLLGFALSTVFSGLWGYSRYSKQVTRPKHGGK